MQRRKFLAGVGSLAAASAVGIGTGAFSSVEADRSVSLNVATDEYAYLGIQPTETATFAKQTGGTVELDFEHATDEGAGLNANADTEFGPELVLTNQGSKDVLVTMDLSAVDDALSGNGSLSFFVHSQAYGGTGATLKQNGGPREGGNQGVILEPGASVMITGLFRNVSADDIPTDFADQPITIYAVSDDSEKWPEAGPSTAGSHVPTFGSS